MLVHMFLRPDLYTGRTGHAAHAPNSHRLHSGLTAAAFIIAVVATTLLLFAAAAKANPPSPDPKPTAACKHHPKAKKCRATVDSRPYRVVVTWEVTDEAGNVTYVPGTCLLTRRGLVDCEFTVRFGL
jgi:hypothetical protein